MTAIETRFIGPTNYRGSRVKAIAMGTRQTVTVEWDDRLDSTQNHKAAAKILIDKQGWNVPHYGPWIMGNSNVGCVFVCQTKYGCEVIR